MNKKYKEISRLPQCQMLCVKIVTVLYKSQDEQMVIRDDDTTKNPYMYLA